jgi:hypothetical protein
MWTSAGTVGGGLSMSFCLCRSHVPHPCVVGHLAYWMPRTELKIFFHVQWLLHIEALVMHCKQGLHKQVAARRLDALFPLLLSPPAVATTQSHLQNPIKMIAISISHLQTTASGISFNYQSKYLTRQGAKIAEETVCMVKCVAPCQGLRKCLQVLYLQSE